jgi:hypothetical protein
MYNFLFDQSYINLFAIAMLLFLIMFLWRKLTILEGNFFLLEKRVNIIKKSDRSELQEKNWEKYDKTMNEIFKDSIIPDKKKNNGGFCDLPINKNKINDDVIIIDDDIILENFDEKDIIPKVISELSKETSLTTEEDISVTHITVSNDNKVFYDVGELNKETTFDNSDNASVSSEITFINDVDKSLTKKYKAFTIDKLKEECIEKQLNIEGTKSQLVSRIIESLKKQK